MVLPGFLKEILTSWVARDLLITFNYVYKIGGSDERKADAMKKLGKISGPEKRRKRMRGTNKFNLGQ